MSKLIPAGTWVQVRSVILPPGQRAPRVPADTAQVPLEMLVKGYLEEPARLGDTVTVRSVIGRQHRGVLQAENPHYAHSFGRPVPELLTIGSELRKMLEEDDER
ncbi:MAG: 2-amino-4-oxopentanoate thiolase subunit OrtA [Bacillota bacterium]|jgi:hypothetical protein